MTTRRFFVWRIAIVACTAAIISVSIQTENYFVPLIAVIGATAFLQLLKHKVEGVLADERDYTIAGNAARYAITAFAIIVTPVIIVFFALKNSNPEFETTASILAYSACLLLILYSVIFKFLHLSPEEKLHKKKTIASIAIAVILMLTILISMRFLSGEDSWVCKNGTWVEHGHPSRPVPLTSCTK